MEPHPNFPGLLQFELFRDCSSLVHFSTTRTGGCGKGDYATFNLGEYAGDDILDVHKNRRQLASMLDIHPKDILLPHQTHDDQILVVDNEFLFLPRALRKERMNGIDALITNRPNVCIGVTTADCVPVLIFDPVERVLAAIHAGWRGTVAHIAGKTIRRMQEVFGCRPENMKAGIAPAISQECFEVGEEVVSAFAGAGFSLPEIAYRHPATRKMHIDLCLTNKLTLNNMGISEQHIELSGMCTCSNPSLFFSARRQGIQSGRMVTGGAIR